MRVFLSTAIATVLAGSTGLAQEEPPEVSVDDSIVVELTGDGPTLEGHGPCRVFHCTSDFEGMLFVWAVSDEVDPFLRITAADDTLLGENDNSGPGNSPLLRIPVREGTELRITAASSPAGGTGFLELRTVPVPETEETRAAAEEALSRDEELERLIETQELEAARSLLTRTWEELSRVPGGELSGEVGEACWSIGFTAFKLDEVSLASAAWRRSLEYFQRVLPEDHRTLIRAHSNLGYTLLHLGELSEAREQLELAVASCERALPERHEYLRQARQNLAATLIELGDLERARVLQEETVEILERTLPEQHVETLAARKKLGVILATQGELESAKALLQEVRDAMQRVLPADDPELLHARDTLALVLRELGDLGSAHTIVSAVLEDLERTLPEDDREILRVKGNLAVIRGELGDLEGSRRMREEVLATISRPLGLDHHEVLAHRVNFGGVLVKMGDFQGAREVYEAVLEDFEGRLDDDHTFLILARESLAGCLRNLGEHEGARELYEAVVAAYERTRPEDHLDVLQTRVKLAALEADQESPQRAAQLYEELVEVIAGRLPADHPLVLQARQSLGWRLEQNGELERARDQYELALKVRERILPEGHPDRLDLRHLLARLHVRFDEAGRARELIAAQHSDLLIHLRSAFLSPPREARVISEDLISRLSLILYLNRTADPAERDEERIFALLETRRHLVTYTPTAREASDEKLRDLRARLSRCRAELSELVLAGPAEEEAMEDWRGTIARVSLERNRLEFALRDALGDVGDAEVVIHADAVARALAPGALAIGYHRYEHRDLDEARCPVADGDHLLALVVSSDGAVRRVELGPVEAIEELVRAWRAATGKPLERGILPESAEAGEEEQGRELRATLFDPILKQVGGLPEGGRLHVCLDDLLHLVPLDALPLDEDGQRVGDRYRVQNEISFARLVSPRPAAEGEGMLLVGDVAFDAQLVPDMVPEGLHAPAAPTRSQARGPILGSWPRLLGTKGEVALLSMLYQESSEAAPQLLSREKATKAALFDGVRGKRFLHLATHGWFAPETVFSVADEAQRAAGASRSRVRETVEGFAPMTLCGLCLAGANQGHDALGRVPGLLTAEELCAFDLSACRLAVLSACQTNVGIARAGQGILSLQSALHAAGARSAITSLWRVPDVFTMELMTAFYEGIWSKGLGMSEALWEAKRMMREQGHPVSAWAGWVLTGDTD